MRLLEPDLSIVITLTVIVNEIHWLLYALVINGCGLISFVIFNCRI